MSSTSILDSSIIRIIIGLTLFAVVFLRPAKPTKPQVKPVLKPLAFQKIDIKKELEKDAPKTGKKYAVVGIGFVGRCIVEMLLERGDGDGQNGNTIVCIDMFKTNPFETNPNWNHVPNTEDRFLQPIENLSKRVEYVQADITNINSLIAALDNKNIDVVFCTAALISFNQRLAYQAELSYKVNVLGAENLCKAMVECGIPNLVFTSTSHVVLRNDSKSRENLTEESPYATKETSYNHYAWSKAEAEKIVIGFQGTPLKKKNNKDDSSVLNIVATRPCSGVFGFNDRLMSQRLAQDPNGQAFLTDSDKSWIQHIYVDNVVFGELLAEKALLERKKGVVGEPFNMCGENVCTEMIYRFMQEYWPEGKEVGVKRLPLTFMPSNIFKYILAPISEFLQWVSNGSLTPKIGELAMLTKPMFDLVETSYTLSCDKAEKLINYRNLFSFEEACQRIAWQYYIQDQLKKKNSNSGEGKKKQ